MDELRRRKQRNACHRWVCWWAWSPILELQTREQLWHGQALRLLRGWAPFRTALLCARASTRESSNWVTASWHSSPGGQTDTRTDGRAGGSIAYSALSTWLCYNYAIARYKPWKVCIRSWIQWQISHAENSAACGWHIMTTLHVLLRQYLRTHLIS